MADLQERLTRIRPPRISIKYEEDTAGAIEKKELPCVIGVIADYRLDRENAKKYEERDFISIDADNFNKVMAAINLYLKISIKEKDYVLSFNSIEDFNPKSIINQIDYCKELFNTIKILNDLKIRFINNPTLSKVLEQLNKDKDISVLDEYLKEKKYLEDNRINILVSVNKYLELGTDDDFLTGINKSIENSNKEMSEILDLVLHNSDFKNLESRWNGLYNLIKSIGSDPIIKVRVLDASYEELLSDTKKTDIEKSFLFKKIYTETFDTYGADSFSFIIFDSYIRRKESDYQLLKDLSNITAAAHAPLITSVHPSLFDVSSFTELCNINELSKVFDTAELSNFNSFRTSEQSKYTALVMPRILCRVPYGAKNPIEGINYEEKIEVHEDLLWTNIVYTYGAIIAYSSSRYGWPTYMSGEENGGIINDLNMYIYDTVNGDRKLKCPTEVPFSERSEYLLSNLGFIPACHYQGSSKSTFFSTQSSHKYTRFLDPLANANSKLSSSFVNMLIAGTLARYFKKIFLGKIGGFSSSLDIKNFMTNLLSNYILLNENTSVEIKRQYPLRGAAVEVLDVPGEPGHYILNLKFKVPNLLEAISINISLVDKINK